MNSWKLIIFIGVNIICCAAYYQQQANNNINVNGNLNYKNLRLIYSWKTLDFLFPNDFTREQAILNGNYIPGAPFPIDVDASDVGPMGPRVFVTIPRFQEGVPITLGYVSNLTSNGNPLIVPYPNWELNQPGYCSHITSVYRIKIDECGRLWVLDTGRLLEERKCPAQLFIFDLTTDRLISRYQFPDNVMKSESLLITPVVDIRGQCSNTFVYIADVSEFQLIVYDHKNKQSWNIQNNLFYPYPEYGRFTIAGESFDLMDGIFGMTLGPLATTGDRILYFHSLASVVESYVPTSIIRNSTLFLNDPGNEPDSFKPFPQRRSTQSGPEAMNNDGILFYGSMSDTAIRCWNSKNYPEFGGSNVDIAVANSKTLQFISGLKIVKMNSSKEQIWVITGRFQKLMSNTLNSAETNFRIQAAYVEDLISGTKCTPLSHDSLYHGQQHRNPSGLQANNNQHYQHYY
ncbi:protein yellow [Microplitis demolitor]|uniref:protein yellow n=1 Tax=Microplitis demolitor TaxID=69319 RepID=UPI0004CCE5B2|nr:protein yellow [Microplitis demolitor]XP_008543961.1 protein yellow [Microplitis demolitor]XP_008543962.1 protein yellow [Microplitis demolitor]XP_008543963.1 protein yellow [Microplitis demolitor]